MLAMATLKPAASRSRAIAARCRDLRRDQGRAAIRVSGVLCPFRPVAGDPLGSVPALR